MLLRIHHQTVYTYDPAASRVGLRLRLYPSEYDGQRPVSWSVTVNGSEVRRLLTDGFGDGTGLWHAHEPCERIEVVASGVVETFDRAGVVAGLRCRPPTRVFLRDTDLTEPDDAIRELAENTGTDKSLDRMHALSEAVREAVDYRANVTDAETTAAQAVALGAGVCQDHAHVFIAAARSLGVPARYVTGYMVAGDEADEPSETHAWVEAYVENLGWVGFDCSNRLCPTDRYVRLGCGLDANHAAPLRGNVVGASDVTLDASVEIAQTQSMTQQ